MTPLIVANWKMNPQNLLEAKRLFNLVKNKTKKIKKVKIVICPPFVFLPLLTPHSFYLKLGAQDIFWQERGAFTGEISPLMLKNFGCQYVIIGHSERREYLAETDKMINKKLKIALKTKLKPIFCIGETLNERKKGKTFLKLRRQIEKGLKGISKREMKNLILAYEPVWAIGTGNPCEPKEAKKMGNLIREIISKIYNSYILKNLPLLMEVVLIKKMPKVI
jgi:triosephosphate isomerase